MAADISVIHNTVASIIAGLVIHLNLYPQYYIKSKFLLQLCSIINILFIDGAFACMTDKAVVLNERNLSLQSLDALGDIVELNR